MNTNLLSLGRIPLFFLLLLSLFLWGIGLPVRADDPPPTTGGPFITSMNASYPTWYVTSLGGNAQDAFKAGDHMTISLEVADDAPITSVMADLSELGVSQPVPLPLFFARDALHKMYLTSDVTITTHAEGTANIVVTATDALGRSSNESMNVRLDNTPPTFSIDSLSFVNTTTTPALEDSMLVSGVIDPSASKAFVNDVNYTLYAADGTAFPVLGSFKPRNAGTALADLGVGAFTDDPIQLWLDRNTEFHLPDAAFIRLTATVIDGAGNSTTAMSPLVRIPKTVSAKSTSGAVSNVLFLPGIEGSRLYEPTNNCDPSVTDCVERKLWDPSSDTDLAELTLETNGKSIHDVYTKEGDTIDAIGPFKFYRSFEDQMNSLKDAGTITDWKSVAYDWRLSLEDLVDKGMQHGERIDYGEATDTPYIEQTLRALAATSKTGKVTIIAHSNGGLVAKKLMQKLGNADTAALIDTVIFVGVPQSGTPQALAGALHGYGSALPADWCAAWEVFGSLCASNASRATSRMLAENMPMAYDLLPSFTYFNDVKDALHPIVAFAADHLFAKERNNYGFIIQNENEQTEFATDQDGGRSKPAPADLTTPNILNANLLGSANEMHAELDTWVPPPQVQVYQVAGWGADTLSGIEYYEAAKASAPGGYVPRYRPEFVEDGDNTVTIPSALMMPIAENVKRYWINLTSKIALQPLGGAVHSNLLEMRGLRELIQNILTGTLQDLLPDGITTTPPANISTRKKLLFTLHGSVHATLKNDVGQTTILNPDGTIVQGIPDVEAGQFGDTGYMLMPVGAVYHLLLDNNDSGTVDLDVQHLIDDTITDTSTFEDIPVGPATPSEVDVSTDGSAASVEVTPLSNVLSTETSSPVPSSGSSSVSSTKTSFVIRTKGVHDSKSVLTPPKPIKVPVVKKVATTTKKIATPKTKPLTAKAKKTISALLNALTAELQGLLTKLPH